ncbi:MAG: sigma-E factor negative regulatory protein [Bacillota bacterium]
MTQKLREQISALADQALPEGEHELLLRRFGLEKSLRLHWERYHLIGEAMRKGLPEADTRGLADRVMAAISQESAPAETTESFRGKLLRGAAGFAVAAAVAVVGITGLRYDAQHGSPAPAEIVPTGLASADSHPVRDDLLNSDWSGNAQPSPADLRSTLMDQEDVSASQALGGKQAYYTVPRQVPPDSAKTPPKKHKTPRQP